MKTKKRLKKNVILESWVVDYADPLYAWALHKVSSKENAEDIVQETFLAATDSFDTCQNKDKPKSWLFAILNNKIIDYYRKKMINSKEGEMSMLDGYVQVIDSLFDSNESWYNFESMPEEAHILDNEEFNVIWSNCMDDLPEKWRLAIQAKYIFNKKGEEICKELAISSSNYWQMIHRAKLLLKVCVHKNWHP